MAKHQDEVCVICGKTFAEALAEGAAVAKQWGVHWATPNSAQVIGETCSAECGATFDQQRIAQS